MIKNFPQFIHQQSLKLRARIFTIISIALLSSPAISLEYLNYDQSTANSNVLKSIVENLDSQGFDWSVTELKGGAPSAQNDLRKRAVKDALPQAALVKGQDIRRWAKLGFLRDLDSVAQEQNWDELLPETISDALKYHGKYVATAVHVHRANWLWINPKALEKAGIKHPPKTWKSFIAAAQKLQDHGITPVLSANEPWQNALIFEAIVMSVAGPEFYHRLFVDHDIPKTKDKNMAIVFEKFAKLRPFLSSNRYENWEEMVSAFLEGKGAFMFAGDWIKSKLNTNKQVAMQDYICAPIPETQTTYLFDIESIAMFKSLRENHSKAQYAMAELIMTESMQTDLNINKGGIPARLDLSPWGFDQCSIRSMREFRSSSKLHTIVPSIALEMTGIERVRRQLFSSLDNFIDDETVPAKDGWLKVSKAIRYGLYLLR